MTKEEAKEVFLNRGFIDGIYDGDKWREACIVISEWLEQEPRKGHWIETAEEYYKAINEKGGGVNESIDYFTDDIACSECLAKFSVIENEADRFDFCPCCGSDNR